LRETGDDRLTHRFGYRPQFDRALRSFESFALGALLLGLLVFGLMLVIEPVAMRHNRGAEGEEALAVAGEVPDERAAEEDLAPAGSRE
jgi:hypothetical protein